MYSGRQPGLSVLRSDPSRGQHLDGKSTSPKVVQLESPRLTNTLVNAQFSPGAKLEPIEIGKNAFPDEPPGLSLPVTPTWVDITAKEAAGS